MEITQRVGLAGGMCNYTVSGSFKYKKKDQKKQHERTALL
jgi:hypothetical protein